MIRYIYVDTDIRRTLLGEFTLTEMGLRKMLYYNSNSEQAYRVRSRALELGGEERCDIDLYETFWDHDGYMRQHFANGVLLEISKESGEARLSKDDVVVATYPNLAVARISAVQAYALSL